jgi:cellulose synthase/poly-beta-1,6-N-acetylglucosamine synthase-like glycosyltransferase
VADLLDNSLVRTKRRAYCLGNNLNLCTFVIWRATVHEKLVVIFPTKNEEDTIEHVIKTTKNSRHSPEIIVVDAYSSDETVRIARGNGAEVIEQGTECFLQKELR